MGNTTSPTIRVEPISPQIQFSAETYYHTNENDSTVDLYGISTDVATPLHRYPTWIRFIEDTNDIDRVAPNAINSRENYTLILSSILILDYHKNIDTY